MRSRPSLPLLVAVLASSAGLAGLGTTAASAAAPTPRWEAAAAGAWFAWGSPVIGDVNNDGSNDVVVGGQAGLLYAHDANGSPRSPRPRHAPPAPAPPRAAPGGGRPPAERLRPRARAP